MKRIPSWLRLGLWWLVTAFSCSAQEETVTPVMSVASVRTPSHSGALAHVVGQVTWTGDLFLVVQDATGAVVVQPTPTDIELGDIVDVLGIMIGKEPDVYIFSRQVTKLENKPLPEPRDTTIEDFTEHGFREQWVRIRGTVHDVAVEKGNLFLVVQGRTEPIMVIVPYEGPTEQAFEMLDAVVEMTGVARLDMVRGSIKGSVRSASRDSLKVLQPGGRDVFSRPQRTLEELRTPCSPLGQRFRMTGVVTYGSPTGWFYFQDSSGASGRAAREYLRFSNERRIFRPLQASPILKRGDLVELVAFRINDASSKPAMPWFASCEWRAIGKGTLPAYEPTEAKFVMQEDYDGKSVTMRGSVVDTQVVRDAQGAFNHTITMEDEGIRFPVLIQTLAKESIPVKTGDYVQMEGVVMATRSPAGFTTSFRLNVNEFTDIRAVSRIWTGASLWRWLLGGAGLAVACFIWISLLRRQVQRQTAQLRESSSELERFKRVADTNSDFVGMVTVAGLLFYLNPAGRKLLGIELTEDISALRLDSFFTPEAKAVFLQEGWPSALKSGHWETEFSLVNRTETAIPVSFTALVIKSADGSPLYLGCSARDISVRLAMDAQLRQALRQEREINQLKTSFVNTISHEFRTPLGIILFASTMMRRYNESFGAEDRLSQLETIDSAVARMNDLVEQSLTLGRAESAQPECGKLAVREFCSRMVREILVASAHSSPVTFHMNPDEEMTAWSDATMLRAILHNLLGNAVKYSPPGTAVELHLTVDATIGAVTFTVRDYGPGLEAEELPKLFTTFHRGSQTSHIPGTGLGLAIVKCCTEALGGTVTADNAVGGGAEFVVKLPKFFLTS